MIQTKTCPITGETFQPSNNAQKYSEAGSKIARQRSMKKFTEANPEKVASYKAKYDALHKDENREYQKARREALKKSDPEYLARLAERAREWREANRERAREISRTGQEKYRNSPQGQEYLKNWFKQHTQQKCECCHHRTSNPKHTDRMIRELGIAMGWKDLAVCEKCYEILFHNRKNAIAYAQEGANA